MALLERFRCSAGETYLQQELDKFWMIIATGEVQRSGTVVILGVDINSIGQYNLCQGHVVIGTALQDTQDRYVDSEDKQVA